MYSLNPTLHFMTMLPAEQLPATVSRQCDRSAT
jgi:hypothetical protein